MVDASDLAEPILPSLRSIAKACDEDHPDLGVHLGVCVEAFVDDIRYRDDVRFHEVLALYGVVMMEDFQKVFEIMEEKGIGIGRSFLYEAAAAFYISKGKLVEARKAYLLGISRKAEPLDRLKKIHNSFLEQLHKKVADFNKTEMEQKYVNPWTASTISHLLAGLNSQLVKYNGYHKTAKNYMGKVELASLKSSSRNKMIELGGWKYHIKGCSGQGGFALVFRAAVDNNLEDIVALKIQSPPFPWEFYMYRQLDSRIPDSERSSFGMAHRVHVYPDWSILVCEYLPHGTLQDAINSYIVQGKSMEEVLCVYYTIEMLRILETLHNAGIIHGDFKPDNLLMRYSRHDLYEHGFTSRTGSWIEQGLCLVDWGRGIDVNLFPVRTEFTGSCRTSCFCCIQMQEKKPWTYQVDTYGLCVIVHMMLHGKYMEVEKKIDSNGGSYYQPKSSLKRYWNIDLWKNLFSTLLNMQSMDKYKEVLLIMRKSFEDYICKSPQLISRLKELLEKQKASLCCA